MEEACSVLQEFAPLVVGLSLASQVQSDTEERRQCAEANQKNCTGENSLLADDGSEEELHGTSPESVGHEEVKQEAENQAELRRQEGNDTDQRRETSIPYKCGGFLEQEPEKMHKEILDAHLRSYTEEKPSQSSESVKCGRPSKAPAQSHELHTEELCHKCLEYGKNFSRSTNLKRHRQIHTGKKLKSRKCKAYGKSFSQRTLLTRHQQIHAGVKPISAKNVENTLGTNITFKQHQMIHSVEKPYQCPVCEKSFSRNAHLVRHKRLHMGEKLYRCSVCEKSFSRNDQLVRHGRLHTGEKLYQCSVCEKRFLKASNLTRHERIHSSEKHMNRKNVGRASKVKSLDFSKGCM